MNKNTLTALLEQYDQAQAVGNLRRASSIVGDILREIVNALPDAASDTTDEMTVLPQVEMTEYVKALRADFILEETNENAAEATKSVSDEIAPETKPVPKRRSKTK